MVRFFRVRSFVASAFPTPILALALALFAVTVLAPTAGLPAVPAASAQEVAPPAGEARAGAELDRAALAQVEFLKETLATVKRFHIDGRKHDDAEYLRGAAEAVAKALDEPVSDHFGAIPAEQKKVLVHALRKEGRVTEFADILRLATAFRAYVAGLDVQAVTDAASQGIVGVLKDPFSRVLNKEQYDQLQKMMRDQSGDRSLGAGLRKNPESGEIEVMFVQWGTIAHDFGFESGDIVRAIDGQDLKKLTPLQVRELLQKEPGTAFTVTLFRPGWKEAHTLRLVQQRNPDTTVYSEMLAGNVGYVRVTMFDNRLDRRMDAAIDGLKAAGARALILDLRNNPGGALQSCLAVADDFIPGGETITTLRNLYPFAMGDQRMRSSDRATRTDLPLVCLINHHSASAAEMLSGALRDTGRATVLGETSFGKGVGQAPIPSRRNRERWFYLTTLEYFLPSGESIQHKGVKPDVEVLTPRLGAAESEHLFLLRDSRLLRRYVEEHFEGSRPVFRRGVSGPVLEGSAYPGLEEFLAAESAPEISDDLLALEVRRELRRYASEKGARRLIADLDTDGQLAAARERLIGQDAGAGK